MDINNLTVADLFAGVGGIATGFKHAGFKLQWANEIDKKACITYRANFSHTMIEDSISNIISDKLEKVDVLAGGFPCQAFSIAGYQKGFADERGNMFFEIMRMVDIIKPPILFLENVKNLEVHDKGNTFRVIKAELKKRGYFVAHKVLNTCLYSDIPQNRERIYIVCFKDELAFSNFKFPEKVSTRKKLSEIFETEADKKYYYEKTKYYPVLKEAMVNRDTVYQWRRIYVRENKNGVCPTLTANMGTGGHNVPLILDSKGIRKLTPRECFRLQGFDDSYILPNTLPDSALYKQAGNSVSVPVIEKIARNIIKALKAKTKNKIFRETLFDDDTLI